MGNIIGAEDQHDGVSAEANGSDYHGMRRNSSKIDTSCLLKLFEKLESSGDGVNSQKGHLSQTTFENAFQGPQERFGKRLFLRMVHGHSEKDHISQHQFVKAGKEILKLYEDTLVNKYYFTLFASSKDHLTKEDALQMVELCYTLTLSASKIPYTRTDEDVVYEAMVTSMFGIHDHLNCDGLASWMSWNSSHLFIGVHSWVMTILHGAKLPSEQELAPVPHLDCIMDGSQLMTMSSLWALSTTLPQLYLQHHEEESASPTTHSPLLNKYNLSMRQAHLSQFQSWNLLYNSSEHGLSMNRFTHHVSSYKGPSVSLISFEGRNIYCVASDTEWRQGSLKFGGEGCQLIQISPVYRVIQAGADLLSWNDKSRDRPRGIQIGKDGKTVALFIPHDFDTIKHYGVNSRLQRLEVWGCGSSSIRLAQVSQKKWESKQVEKSKQQKLKLDPNWEENPDKQLLEWGGIRTAHSER